jgi:hypothetical protein
VVYDSPADHRLHKHTAIEADVFRLGDKAAKSPRPRSRR